jgi:hypothetical protein
MSGEMGFRMPLDNEWDEVGLLDALLLELLFSLFE